MGLSRWDGGSGRNFGPAARAIEPVQDVDVRVKKSVAPSKRSHRCFFGIVSSDPHGGQNSPLWLIISCERGRSSARAAPGLDFRTKANTRRAVVLKFDSGTFQRRLHRDHRLIVPLDRLALRRL